MCFDFLYSFNLKLFSGHEELGEMHVGPHVKNLLFLSDFNLNINCNDLF